MSAQIVESVTAMVGTLVAQVQATEVSLEQLEQAVLAGMHTVGTVTLTALIGALAPAYPAPTSSCACGGEAVYQRMRSAQCKTLLGVVQVRRAYYLCSACHHGHCPVDQELGLCAGSISAGLEALMALMGAEFSFAHAAEMVAKLSLVQVSASRCREATTALGASVAAQDEQQWHRVWAEGKEPAPPLPQQPCEPLYVSADGVMVHTRERGWREQCVGAIYTTSAPEHPLSHRRPQQTAHAEGVAQPAAPGVAPVHQRSRAVSYVSDFGVRSKFSQLLWLEAHRRGLEQAQTVVFIGDGAHWLWEAAAEHFPHAMQILDWFHASSYIGKLAQAFQATAADERKAWAERLLDDLWQSRTADVIAALATLSEDADVTAAVRTAARDAATYFTFHRARMDYKHYRTQGLQIGSGTIESACKSVIQARIKQAGMRWNECNLRNMGKLRTRLRSNRWDETLSHRPQRSRAYLRHPA